MTNESSPRSLPLLRAMIDALDHELLQIAVRRMRLVAEIAEYKREHGLRIRDRQREREVLQDRVQRAIDMGLPSGEIESIFRVLLRASRDHQASLRAELPRDTEARVVAIIGGHGGMGALMARLFGDLGHQVLVADLDTDLTAPDAAAEADVVVISVPIEATDAVIREVGPHVREDALLMDVTSIKQEPVRVMLECTRASVAGTHPMFGPNVHSLQGQRVVLCRGRGDAWATWVARMLGARGLIVEETTPEHHDRMMAVVQVLTHFQTQVVGLTIARSGVTLQDTLRFTSPAYLMELFMTARHFDQSPDLYGPIAMRNPATGQVTAAFRQAADEVASIFATQDLERFRHLFDEVRQFLGGFTHEALEQTSFLIDRLVERQ